MCEELITIQIERANWYGTMSWNDCFGILDVLHYSGLAGDNLTDMSSDNEIIIKQI